MRSTLLMLMLLACLPAAFAAESLGPEPDPVEWAAKLDRQLAEEINPAADQYAPRINDYQFARRAYLDLVATIPHRDELIEFVEQDDPDKREALVQRLLKRESFGVQTARYWRDVILSRLLDDRAMLVAQPLVRDMSEWVNEDRPWDAIAREFITATGEAKENGATALIIAQNGQTSEVAAEVSRVFLGVQIQCAQCHDHPWDSWKREQFHELAAFFPRVGARPKPKVRPPELELVVNDRQGSLKRKKPANVNRRGWPEHFMPDLENPAAKGTQMTPRFFLTGLEQPVGTSDADRRAALADALTQERWFSIAIVNRMWAELIGEGFYEQVDDLGPERTATAPKTLALLADGFEQSGYRLKWLYRTIMATEAYQRDSRPRRAPAEPAMVATLAQPLRGDALFNALFRALDIDPNKMGRVSPPARGQRSVRDGFNQLFGYDPSLQRDLVSSSIPQLLARMNHEPINRSLQARSKTMLDRLLDEVEQAGGGASEVIDELYLRLLSRYPTERERQIGLDYRDTDTESDRPWEDLLWALVNSAEFAHRR